MIERQALVLTNFHDTYVLAANAHRAMYLLLYDHNYSNSTEATG